MTSGTYIDGLAVVKQILKQLDTPEQRVEVVVGLVDDGVL